VVTAMATTDGRMVREAVGRFASGVTIVTTRTHDGSPAGCTVSAFCSLSLSPPLILVCIGKDRRMHRPLTETGGFAVNVLGHDQAELAKRFAGPAADRFDGVVWTPGYLGVPVLGGTIASVQCRRWDVLNGGGDHAIVVGQIVDLATADGEPLLYSRGAFVPLAGR
jgi:3-hydroxy-9,10-secoandrosta-1,3,5(10)-triene-9,17-dione monooxygenase reductase component